MANLIARIAVLLVLAAAGMVLADRKEKIDLSVSPVSYTHLTLPTN